MKEKTVIALAGNPNSGKTTLFNLLTGSGEATGNRAGVTFQAKLSPLKMKGYSADIADLPGMYSLSPFDGEEKPAKRFLTDEGADVIIDIADATNLERALYLATELSESYPRVILALNMMDEAEKEGLFIDIALLSKLLGIDVIPISASKKEGIDELIFKALHTEKKKLIKRSGGKERFEFCSGISKKVIKENREIKSFSDKADRYICRGYIGIPLFFLIIFIMFFLVFSGPVAYLSSLFSKLFSLISDTVYTAMSSSGFGKALCGIVCNGFLKGVGAVISFLPQTAMLFFLLELLEDIGYLPRAAYVADRITRHIGISGKAFIPFLLGFGCTVPAVMSASALEINEKKPVVSSLSFIPCSARFPVFAMITGCFFPENPAFVSFLIYSAGVICAFAAAAFYSKKQKLPPSPLVIELPKLRAPVMRNLFRAMKIKVGAFAVRAGSIVFISSGFVYFLSMFDTGFHFTEIASQSILACIGKTLSTVLSSIGLSDWRLCASLFSGIFAKETIVSSLLVLTDGNLMCVLDMASAASFCSFSLLYLPCLATVSVMKKEIGFKTTFFSIFLNFIFAYLFSYIVYTFFHFFSSL